MNRLTLKHLTNIDGRIYGRILVVFTKSAGNVDNFCRIDYFDQHRGTCHRVSAGEENALGRRSGRDNRLVMNRASSAT